MPTIVPVDHRRDGQRCAQARVTSDTQATLAVPDIVLVRRRALVVTDIVPLAGLGADAITGPAQQDPLVNGTPPAPMRKHRLA